MDGKKDRRFNSGNFNGSDDDGDLRRGTWTVEEDKTLINYIAIHGDGRWNYLARCAGLKRTGKSCRLRWLNYLRPEVRRGNISLEEQLLILELHSRWGNRWSKIAQQLPGRTDNEIKNYWRTRVQKHAKQLKCDVNSKQFKDTMRYLWMPRLVERIQAAASSAATTAVHGRTPSFESTTTMNNGSDFVTTPQVITPCYSSENFSSGGGSSDRRPCSSASEFTDGSFPVLYGNETAALPPLQGPAVGFLYTEALDFPAIEQSYCKWITADGGVDSSASFWSAAVHGGDDFWLLQQQLN